MSVRTPTWYDLLDVEPTASTDEIRAAWRAAIAELEPTERRFATLNEAAAVLLDPARRSAYDEGLRAAEPDAEPEPEPDAEPEVSRLAALAPQPPGEDAEPPQPPGEEPDAEKPRKAPYLPSGWLLAVVAVIALVCAVLAGVLSTRPSPDKIVQADVQLSSGSKVTRIEQHVLDAQAAAKEAVVPILSYDYRHLDADQAKSHGFMTDSYRAAYDKLFDALKKSAVSTKTVITTKVVSSAIVRADTDRVQVLLFVDRPTTNAANTTPVPYQDQVTLTMQHVGGRWLVDNMVTNQIPD